METQKLRDSLIDRAASAFALDKLDEAAFESLVSRVQAASGEAELRAVEAGLGAILPPAPAGREIEDAREFSLNMSNLKKRGDWVDAKVYRLEGKMSNFELDYRAYADEPGFNMRLEVDLSMSNLKVRVPTDWQVDCRISNNTGSNVKDKGPFPKRGASRIVIEGDLSMSNIQVMRKGPRRGIFALLFGK